MPMLRIQIIDDDPFCGEAIAATLRESLKTVRIEVNNQPTADDGRDVYIVDNEFEKGDHGVDLVKRIRAKNPDAAILLCSATYDRIDLREAMNAGCNALIRKGNPKDLAELSAIIDEHNQRQRTTSKPGLGAVLADMKAVITAWNKRLEQDAANA